MEIDLNIVKNEVQHAIDELIADAKLVEGDIVVLGGSSSEILGSKIGKNTSIEVAKVIIDTILPSINKHKLFLAVQGCEHINRALVVEKEIAIIDGLEIVSVVPVVSAGGGMATAAFNAFSNPVMVEHIIGQAGIDIGDTSIGMHIKHVQIPIRLSVKQIGHAHVTYLKSRPKLIGGPRAQYER